MNGRTIRKYLFLPLVAIAALSMTGCTKGEYTAPGGTVNESGFRLSVVTKSMSRKEVVTRASDPAKSRSCTYSFSDRTANTCKRGRTAEAIPIKDTRASKELPRCA